MAYFPLCVNLEGARVLLVGNGAQIREKAEKLRPFGAMLYPVDTLSAEDLEPRPILVVVGDTEYSEAERVSALCKERGIPVNVVDMPELCTFFFPALIQRGDLTVSVTTGGKSPAAASYLRRSIEELLPERTEEILDWLGELREELPAEQRRMVLSRVVQLVFEKGRELTSAELDSTLQHV